MQESIFSYRGLRQLCNLHLEEIIELHSCSRSFYDGLEGVLEHRQVRFINPNGQFDYTKFGHFYFDKEGVMMLITDDKDYTIYHRPDILSDTFWSTVPVIFAGVDIRMTDDMGRDVFTGDVVTYQSYTSVVRYFGSSVEPGLIGDNCDIQFSPCDTFHKDGTAFVDVNPTMFKEYDPLFVRWAANGFGQFGSFEEIREKASIAMNVPTFIGGTPKKRRMHRLSYGDIEEVLTDDMVLAYLRDSESYEDEEGEPVYNIFADDLPDHNPEKRYEICIPDKEDFVEGLKEAIKDFLLYAHRHPEETFVYADFKGFFHIAYHMELRVAECFDDWFEFHIYNVILPRWIFFRLGSWHQIGKD